jgi:hypothetical protein
VFVKGVSERMEIKEGESFGERSRHGRNKVYVGNFRWKPGGNSPLGRPNGGWEDKIKTILNTEGCGLDSSRLGKGQLASILNAIINI